MFGHSDSLIFKEVRLSKCLYWMNPWSVGLWYLEQLEQQARMLGMTHFLVYEKTCRIYLSLGTDRQCSRKRCDDIRP
jgi:hypothetical protein